MKYSRSCGLHRLVLVCLGVCAFVVVSCAQAPRGLLAGTAAPPVDVQQACALATQRCSHCHPIERVVVTRGIGVRHWQLTVEQMRLKPSSGISLSEADIIFRCLRFIEETCTECKQGRS